MTFLLWPVDFLPRDAMDKPSTRLHRIYSSLCRTCILYWNS